MAAYVADKSLFFAAGARVFPTGIPSRLKPQRERNFEETVEPTQKFTMSLARNLASEGDTG